MIKRENGLPGVATPSGYSFAGAALLPGFDRPVAWRPVAGDRGDFDLPAADGTGEGFAELPRRSAAELERDMGLDSFDDRAAVGVRRSSTVRDR